MQFYQVKMIRKGLKPPVWRRCLVPAGVTFAQMAVILEDMLGYEPSDQYEYEFYQRKVHVREWQEGKKQIHRYLYDYRCSSDTMVNDLMDEEPWFTFRMQGMPEAPEYRIEIEKKLADAAIGQEKTPLSHPLVLKEVDRKWEPLWGDRGEYNDYLAKAYLLTEGEADYRTFRELTDGIRDKKAVWTVAPGGISRTDRKEKGPEISTRNPDLRGWLARDSKASLAGLAKDLGIPWKGVKKADLAKAIAQEIVTEKVVKKKLLQAEEWERTAFLRAAEQGLFYLSDKDEEELAWALDIGYLVAYQDDYAEVPGEIKQIVQKVYTPEFRRQCELTGWMRACLHVFEEFYVAAPVRILYRMYRQRDGYRVKYPEFLNIFHGIPEEENNCVIRDDKVILKELLKDKFYEALEDRQRDLDFYIPAADEVLDLAKNGYPSQSEDYRKMREFFLLELNVDAQIAEVLLCLMYREISMDGELSDAMEHLETQGITFASEKQVKKFANLYMNMNNRTRKFLLRGHTPEEVVALRPHNLTGNMPTIVPMSSMAAEMLAGARDEIEKRGFSLDLDSTAGTAPETPKKIYPNDPCPCGSGKKYKKCCGRK